MSPLNRFFLILALVLAMAAPASAVVEIAWSGQKPQQLDEVYNRNGMAYMAIDDVLEVLRLQGRWHSVDHLYRFRTPMGEAAIFPGGHYLRIGDQFIPLEHPPQFIDGRLRVAEDFVVVQLPALTGNSIYYRNLNPPGNLQPSGDGPLDQLFAFLLRKKGSQESQLRAIAIDVGHGGQDPGAIGLSGVKEKDVVFAFGRQLEKLLKMQLGVNVYLSRDGDYSLDQEGRLKAVARPDVDAYILLHAQGHFSPAVSGIELYIRPDEALGGVSIQAGEVNDSLRLAAETRQALLDDGFDVAPILQAPLLPLGRGDLPTVLVELGYLTNRGDLAILNDNEARQMLARAILAGLSKFSQETRSQK
jgi:N-acetylmuramoyl-L-alanine amidase